MTQRFRFRKVLVSRLTNSGPVSSSPLTLSPKGGEGRVRGLKRGKNLSNGVLVRVLFLLTGAAGLVSFGVVSLQAEEGYHDHAAAHGGYFGDAGNLYHYEVLLEEGRGLKLYLYDEEARPMKVTKVPARWTISPDGENPVQGPFQEGEEGEFYRGELPANGAGDLHLLIEVEKAGKWVPLEFYLPEKKS